MRLIDADHLISILKEYIKRENSYISICNNPTLAKGIKRGLQEAVQTVNKEPTAQSLDAQEAYYKGKIDAFSECRALFVKKVERGDEMNE